MPCMAQVRRKSEDTQKRHMNLKIYFRQPVKIALELATHSDHWSTGVYEEEEEDRRGQHSRSGVGECDTVWYVHRLHYPIPNIIVAIMMCST